MPQGRQTFHRSDRVRKALIREVSDIIRQIKDPRLTEVVISVTDVEVTQDLSFARIFLSVMGDTEVQDAVMTIINEAKPQIRTEIGRRIRLRYTPQIEFHRDDSLERGARISQLLDRIAKGEDT